jgi:hypothetical protein
MSDPGNERTRRNLLIGRRLVVCALLIVLIVQVGTLLLGTAANLDPTARESVGLEPSPTWSTAVVDAMIPWIPLSFICSLGLGLAGLLVLREAVQLRFVVQAIFLLLLFVPVVNLIPLLSLMLRASGRLRVVR